MVLAAGAGRRLRPDTDDLPKALLPVDGERTILELALSNLAAAGLTRAVIVVGYAAHRIAERVPALARGCGMAIELVPNDRAEDWNNAYSLWLAREYFGQGVLLVNGDTVHPASVEKTLLAASTSPAVSTSPAASTWPAASTASPLGRLIIALDDVKPLADEEMKVVLDERGLLRRITKEMDPAHAHGEYIGATLIEPSAAAGLADALAATWRRDPNLYYEDGFAEFAQRGGDVLAAPIGVVDWVEVDNHADLRRAREIASRC
jgi:choline kinase